MKTEDFKRLKAICEKEGFDIASDSFYGKTYYHIEPRDIWEGVEFAECVQSISSSYTIGKIYKLIEPAFDRLRFINNKGEKTNIVDYTEDFTNKGNNTFKPSTESAYNKQLKKEAFERFGEIKERDRFDRDFVNYNGEGNAVSGHSTIYFKEADEFYMGGICIYQAGKWATRVRERVEVNPINSGGRNSHDAKSIWDYEFKFQIIGRDPEKHPASFMYDQALPFLASQLEKYLNGEIE